MNYFGKIVTFMHSLLVEKAGLVISPSNVLKLDSFSRNKLAKKKKKTSKGALCLQYGRRAMQRNPLIQNK